MFGRMVTAPVFEQGLNPFLLWRLGVGALERAAIRSQTDL